MSHAVPTLVCYRGKKEKEEEKRRIRKFQLYARKS